MNIKWIPVSEQLPEPDTTVLASFDDGAVVSLMQNWADVGESRLLYFAGFDGETKSLKYHKVLAWMPMPKAFKSKK